MKTCRLFAFLCLLLCGLPAAMARADETDSARLSSLAGAATPALWRVADEDTTIYLFGTVHMLPEGIDWQHGRVAAALDSADQIVIETVLPDDPMAMAATMFRLGTAPDLPPLAARLPGPARSALERHMARLGLSPGSFDRFKSWSAAIILQSISLEKAGLDSDRGIERHLLRLARTRAIPVAGLESIEEQLSIFNGIAPARQDAMLASTLDGLDKGVTPVVEMLASWRTGDIEGLAATLISEMAYDPDLAHRLIDARNARWADWISTRLAAPGVIFVAVGAGHLGGPASVQHFLAQKGVPSTRLQ